MAIPVEMPKMSDTMEEGVLVAWLAEEGDAVSAGDVIAQVETDKATMDLEVYDDGVLLKRVVGEGEAVPIGALIAVLGKEGEDPSKVLAKYGGDGAGQDAEPEPPAVEVAETETAETETAETETVGAGEAEAQVPSYGTPGAAQPVVASGDGAPAPQPSVETGGDERLKASPLARRLARDHGVDLGSLSGSGPEGRIVKRDVEAAMGHPAKETAPAAQPVAPKAPAPVAREEAPAAPTPKRPAETPAVATTEEYEAVRLSQMRKAIARRLAQSKYTAPHFYLTVDLDMERAVAVRSQINGLAEQQGRPSVSFNDFITKACAVALRHHPEVNAAYLEQEGEIRRFRQVHVGVAVAIDEGLVTPVIRNADQKGLSQIAEETRALAERARDRKLQPQEMEGSTFTTSNLGMFGIEQFTAIINPPNACILAIGTIRDVPVVKDGAVVPGKRMKLTLSCDHRVVDGAVGARFLTTVRHFLEEPMNLLL